jgi:hypothetical protein
VERAQALERSARLAQLDALADQLDQIELLFDFCGDSNGRGRNSCCAAMLSKVGRSARPACLVGSRQNPPDTVVALSSLDKATEVKFTP